MKFESICDMIIDIIDKYYAKHGDEPSKVTISLAEARELILKETDDGINKGTDILKDKKVQDWFDGKDYITHPYVGKRIQIWVRR